VKIISTRRLLLAAGSSLALLGAAAPAAAQSPPSDYWSGWYIGLNAGGSWGDNNLNRQVTAGGSTVTIPPADIALINSNTSSSNSNKTGFTGGIEGGYNYLSTKGWLFGIEADWVALSVNTRDSHTFTSAITQPIIPPPPPTQYTINQRADTDWMVSIRPRLGFTSGQWLFYGTAGVAFADVKSRLEGMGTLPAGSTPRSPGRPARPRSDVQLTDATGRPRRDRSTRSGSRRTPA